MDQLALFAKPAPEPLDGGILIGTRRDDIDALVAAAQHVEVCLGPHLGWRRYGKLVGVADGILKLSGRLLAGPTFDIGSPKPTPDQPPA